MCDLCDGVTLEERMRWAHLSILGAGYSQIAVEGSVPWVYTIGLSERLHPELLIAGIDTAPAAELLDRLASRVVRGERFEAGTTVDEEGESFGLVAVHPSRVKVGLCAAWQAYARLHPGPGTLRVLQVQMPDEWFCRCHAGNQPRLELPGGMPGAPSREERRRKSKRRR